MHNFRLKDNVVQSGNNAELKLGHMEVYIKFLQYSEYVINNKPIWVRNGCPCRAIEGFWYGWARDWDAMVPGFDPHPFFFSAVNFKLDRLCRH